MADSERRGTPVPAVVGVILVLGVGALLLVIALSPDGAPQLLDDPDPPSGEPDADGQPDDPAADDPDGTAPEQPPDEEALPAVDDLAGVGANAEALLRPEIPRLVIEIAVQQGVTADPAAREHLVDVLARETDKPDGIEVVETTFADDRDRWSAADLRELAAEQRTAWSDRGAATVFVAYVGGAFEREETLGVALNASEAALFPEQWDGLLEGLLASDADVERAVLTHEVGHLLGLVELVRDSRHDREHPDAPGHSRNEGSVMHPAVRTTAVAHVFDGPPPDDFDEADRDDLRELRAGQG